MQTQLSRGFKIFLLQIVIMLILWITNNIISQLNNDVGYAFEFALAALLANAFLQKGTFKEMLKRTFFSSLFFSLLFLPLFLFVSFLVPYAETLLSVFEKLFLLIGTILISSFVGGIIGSILRFKNTKKPSEMQARSRN